METLFILYIFGRVFDTEKNNYMAFLCYSLNFQAIHLHTDHTCEKRLVVSQRFSASITNCSFHRVGINSTNICYRLAKAFKIKENKEKTNV